MGQAGVSMLRIRALLYGLTVLLLSVESSEAVPAFADQTGQTCATCHIGAFGPHLTPYGRQFKLNGYTLRVGDFTPPLSAIAIASFLHTQKDQPPPPARHFDVNDNAAIDHIAAFVAGGFGEQVGIFAVVAYEGVDRHFHWDDLDFRVIDHATILGSDLTYGLSVNNEPTGQDVWATLPIWGFPFTTSELAPSPTGAPQIDDNFAQTTLGFSAYAWWNSEIYAEVALYRSLSQGMLRFVGEDTTSDLIDGFAPYFRIAYQKDLGKQNFELGAFSFFPSVFPARDRTTGKTDDYADVGVDASYEFVGNNDDVATVNARYTHEDQRLSASQILGGASNRNNTLNEFNLNGSYYWHELVGGTVGYFQTWGNPDTLLYAGNRTFAPDTGGFIFQIDGAPFEDKQEFPTRINLRIGIQYTAYTEFDGASRNFDGLGRNASDNNSIRLFVWAAF
jgi:hypothetical protein